MRELPRYFIIASTVFLIAQASADTGDVSAVRYSTNGQVVAAGYNDGKIALLERNSGKKLWESPGKGKQILGLYFRKKDTQLVAFERHGLIRCLEVATGREVKKLQAVFGFFLGSVQSRLALAEFDQLSDLIVLAGDFSPSLYLINAERAITGPENLVLRTGVYTVDPETGIAIWNREDSTQSPAVKSVLMARSRGGFTNMRFSSKYGIAVAVLEERQLLFVWKLASDRSGLDPDPVIREFGRSDHDYTGLAIGADGDVVTVGYTKKYGGIQLWDFGRMELIHWLGYLHHGGYANNAVFSHSGEIVVTSDELINIVWKKKEGKLQQMGHFWHGKITGGYERPSAVAFSPDDKELAIGIGPAVAITAVQDLKAVKYIGLAPASDVKYEGDNKNPRTD